MCQQQQIRKEDLIFANKIKKFKTYRYQWKQREMCQRRSVFQKWMSVWNQFENFISNTAWIVKRLSYEIMASKSVMKSFIGLWHNIAIWKKDFGPRFSRIRMKYILFYSGVALLALILIVFLNNVRNPVLCTNQQSRNARDEICSRYRQGMLTYKLFPLAKSYKVIYFLFKKLQLSPKLFSFYTARYCCNGNAISNRILVLEWLAFE